MTITHVGIALIAVTAVKLGESDTLRTLVARAPQHHAPSTAPPAKRYLPALKDGGAVEQPAPAGAAMLAPLRIHGNGVQADGLATGGAPTGAVGDTHYVQLAGGQLAIFDKADGALLLGPVALRALFAGSPCDAGDSGPPLVRYDHLAKRWILVYQAGKQQCIAVSSSDDASGRYFRYALPIEGEDARLAVWPDAYYLTLGLFDEESGAWRGPRVCGLARAALLGGAAPQWRCHDPGSAYGPITPVGLDGYPAPLAGNDAATLLSLDFTKAGQGERLLLWRYSFSRDRIGDPVAIPVAPFRVACAAAPDGACIAQPAPGAALVAAGERLMPGAAYRSVDGVETLVASHAVQLGAGVGIRWYELRAEQLYQQGTHGPDHDSRWMGSMAIDKAGNIGLGYQVAGRGTPPGIRLTGRQRGDPHGRMQGELFIISGTGVQTDPAAGAGQHGALAVDPVDGCTFWQTQQYIAVTGSGWRTRLVSVRFQNCR